MVVSSSKDPLQLQISRFRYDPRTNRYRDIVRGTFVAPESVRRALDTMIDIETGKAKALSQSLRDGTITLAHWQTEMTTLLKHLHVTTGLAACGGMKNTTPQQLGTLAQHIKGQYTYLREMAMQIRTGQQPLNGTLLSRTALYTQASRVIYSSMVAQQAQAQGKTEERNILGHSDHCALCLEETSKGWVPTGSLLPIGERTCLQNCRCILRYR